MLALSAWILLPAALVSQTQREQPPVVIVFEATAGSHVARAAGYLEDQLDHEPLVATTTTSLDPQVLLRLPRPAWKGRAMVLINDREGKLTVVRPSDKTELSRSLGRKVLLESPYAVAVSAVELVELAYGIRRDSESPIPEDPGGLFALVGAGLSLSASPGSDLTLVQPGLALLLLYRSPRRSWWGAAGAEGRFWGVSAKDFDASGEAIALRYVSHELGLKLAAGLTEGSVDIGLVGIAGVSLTDARALGAADTLLGERDRVLLRAGVGGEVRYRALEGFGLELAGRVELVPKAGRYLVREEVGFDERVVRALGTLSLTWESD